MLVRMKRNTTPTVRHVVVELRRHGSARNVAGMRRFGIQGGTMYGVSVVNIRAIGKSLPRDHELALKLWKTGVHEARILASIVDEPERVTRVQMDRWARDFDSWDVCDQVCMNLFDKTPYAFAKALAWSRRKEKFVKRAGFALMAALAVHAKQAPDAAFIPFLRAVEREATDGRTYVRKAANWALRQIGKRNMSLNRRAVAIAKRLKDSADLSSHWVGADAYRELTSASVQKRVHARVHSPQ